MKNITAIALLFTIILALVGCTNQAGDTINTTTAITTQATTTMPSTKPTTAPEASVQLSLAGIAQELPLSPAFMDVLYGKSFYDVRDEEEQYLLDYSFPNACSIFDENRVSVKLVDMDQDGKDELIFRLVDTLILREDNGTVYGYSFSCRQMDGIYADGSFDTIGNIKDGYSLYTIKFLPNGGYETDRVCKIEYGEDETKQYFVADEPASKEEYDRVYHAHIDTGIVISIPLSEFAPYDVRYLKPIDTMRRFIGYRLDDEFDMFYYPGEILSVDPSMDADSYELSCMFLDLLYGVEDPSFHFSFIDLNVDGVLELIVFRSDGFIHAIFTLVDGEPKMVDAFWSERWAKINQAGYIMIFTDQGEDLAVSVNDIIPNSTDYQVVAQFGMEKDRYFKVVDHVDVTIDTEEFNALANPELLKVQYALPISIVGLYYNREILN